MMNLTEALEEYLLNCELKNYSKGTVDSKRLVAELFIRSVGNVELNKVTATTVKKYILELQKINKANTINTKINHLRGMFEYFVNEETIVKNPMAKVSMLKEEKEVIRTYSTDMIIKVLEKLEGLDFLTIRNKAIFILLIESGIRCSELCNIKIEDINENSIKIHGKGNKVRLVPITQAISEQLVKYLKIRQQYLGTTDNEYLFFGRTRTQLQRVAINRITDSLFEGMEMDGVPVTVHNFRRFFAQSMLDNVDLYTVSRLLGHGNIKTTERYVRGTEDAKILERGMNSPLSKMNI